MAQKKKSEVSDLKSHIGYRMRAVSNAVSHAFAGKLSAHGVTVAEWVILREMYSANDTSSPSILATRTGLTRGAVSKLVERLLKKGLLTRTESAEDRRYQDIELTSNALKLVPKLARIADENDDSFFSLLPKSEKKALMDTLTRLAELHGLSKSPVE